MAPPDRQHDETGRFVEKATLDDVLGVFDGVHGPVVTSGDVAEHLDISTEAARRKLGELHDQGRVERRKTPARTVVYWRPGDGDGDDEPVTDDGDDSGSDGSGSDGGGGITTRTNGITTTKNGIVTTAGVGDADDLDDVVNAVGDEILAGTGDKLAERKAAFRAVVEYLRENGEATRSDFIDDVYPDYPARYTEGKNPPKSWWQNAILPALSELRDRVDVIALDDSTSTWMYRPDDTDDTDE